MCRIPALHVCVESALHVCVASLPCMCVLSGQEGWLGGSVGAWPLNPSPNPLMALPHLPCPALPYPALPCPALLCSDCSSYSLRAALLLYSYHSMQLWPEPLTLTLTLIITHSLATQGGRHQAIAQGLFLKVTLAHPSSASSPDITRALTLPISPRLCHCSLYYHWSQGRKHN